MFTAEVKAELGEDQAALVERRISELKQLLADAPDRASWLLHLPIPLVSKSADAAQEEMAERLRPFDPNREWFVAVAVSHDGSRRGYASEHFYAAPTPEALAVFLFFDLHTRMGGWWLSHLWRAVDLAEATETHLAQWQVICAAACARALLEGTAAFVVEGESLHAEWSDFKLERTHSLSQIEAFRVRFGARLLQAHMGTRVGERTGQKDGARLKRTNVMTFLEKFAKRVGERLWETYEWLCDAVHPAFGSATVFTATQGIHGARTTFAADIARRTIAAPTLISRITPTVARAVVEALDISVEHLVKELPRIRWLIDDFGMTTEAAFVSRAPFFGAIPRPNDRDSCPCGSGRTFGECVHSWGLPTAPDGRPGRSHP